MSKSPAADRNSIAPGFSIAHTRLAVMGMRWKLQKGGVDVSMHRSTHSAIRHSWELHDREAAR